MGQIGHMARWAAIPAVLLTMACGSGDEGSTPDVSATGAGGSGSATASRCLDLVAQGSFDAAVDACAQAARENPANQEIAQALASARESVSEAAENAREAARDAAAAARKAGEDAAGQASQAVEDAKKSASETSAATKRSLQSAADAAASGMDEAAQDLDEANR